MYEIFLGDQVIGKAQVAKEGLYYTISCRCRLSGDVVYKICVSCGDRQADLGVCVPKEQTFGVDTKLPVKHLGEGNMRFCAVPRHPPLQQEFVPIRADEPFAYLVKLNKAYFAVRNGQVGALLKD